MKKTWMSLVSIAVVTMLLVSWEVDIKPDNYDRLWKKVRQYTQKDLLKSALKTVDIIYTQAKAGGNENQVIKSMLYRISLQSKYQENFRVKSIRLFEKERQTASPVEKQLISSLLGQLYHGYFDSHLNKILNRKTPAAAGDTSLAMRDARQWNLKIQQAYLASVSSPEASEMIPLSGFSAILQNDSSASSLWPTLYDLLANRAISYFSSNDARRWLPRGNTALDTSLLAPAADFMKINFSNDTATATGKVLLLFQHLLRLHKDQHHPIAFVDADLKRLDFVKSQLPHNFSTETTYVHSLQKLLQQFQGKPVSVRVAHRLAQAYLVLASYDKGKTNYRVKAEETCKKALAAFPSAPFANNCKNTLSHINRPVFSIKMQQALLPDKPFLAFVNVRNSPKLWLKVVKIPSGIKTDNDMRTRMKKYLRLPAFKNLEQSFPFTPDHRRHTAEIAMPALPVGSYVVFVSDSPKFTDKNTVLYQQIQVTRLALLSRKNNKAQALDAYLLDRSSGAAVSGVDVKAFARSYNHRSRQQRTIPLGTFSSGENGFLQIPLKNNDHYNGFVLEASKGGDTTIVNTFARFYGSLYEERPYSRTYFFTDRSIYRPGQTVYFKAVVASLKGNDIHIKAGAKVDVQLMSAQYKKLDELHLVTDASGSVSGSFVLPDEALNGRFILKTATGMKGILMENYKRPTFHVDIQKPSKAFALNDEVSLTGKVAYYFGGKADSIPVKYTVKRERYFPMPYYGGWYPQQPAKTEIAGGTVRTDNQGRFHISFKALPDKSIPRDAYPVYRFVLHLEATDASGETHVATQDIRLSRLAVLLSFQMPDNVISEQSGGVVMEAKNLSGVDVPATVHLEVYKLISPDHYLLPRLWSSPDTVLLNREVFRKEFPHQPWPGENDKNSWSRKSLASLNMNIRGRTTIFTKRLQLLKPGEYLVIATVKGQPSVSVKKFFTISSERSKKLPVKTIFWHILSGDKAEPGDVLQLNTGSVKAGMHILYEVLNGRQVIQRQWITTGRKLTKIEIPVDETFRGNFFVRLTTIHDNRFFSWAKTVQVPFSNKKLQLGVVTNRNFLKPGEKEQWTVNVSTLSGKPQRAFLLAGMYDASLDVYAANRWKMFPYHVKSVEPAWRSYLFNAGYDRTLFSPREKFLPATSLSYPRINWFGYPFSYRNHAFALATSIQKEAEVQPVGKIQEAPEANNKKPVAKISSPLPPETKKLPRPLRTNFNATAFFYPNLVVDSTGSTSLSFTTPDALTQWKFMALAYTKDMKTGYFEQKFTARKALMVVPNLPRFVRQGDRLLFTARLSNLSDKTLPVKVNIAFFNPENGKKLNLFLTRKTVEQHLTIKPNENTVVSWLIHIPDDVRFVAYRIKAVSGENSDGEQRMIPVLSNRELITESMPMFVNGNQHKTFVFHHFLKDTSASRSDFRYTLSFTSHPVWYAVQALPYLSKPQYESAQNIFYRFYAHALAGKLLETYPRIQQVFAQWKQQSPDAFLSALQKDKELKNIVLQATPWVLEAQNETEQNRWIALFFDLNQMRQKQQTAFTRLQAAQLPSGAWSWFPDMPADIFTTQNILSGIAMLMQMKAVDMKMQPALKVMLKKGLRYLDNEMLQEYNRIKTRYPKTENKYHLTSSQVRYCYLRSGFLSTIPPGKNVQKAFDYFSGQMKQYWPRFNNNLQALSAITLNRLGWENQAEAIIRALGEKSLLNKQNGMYWRNDNPYANQSAISTEVNIMKAFVEVMNDTRSADKMKTWLLMQKQASHWPGTKATADAVYALIMNGSPLLSETKPVDIGLGDNENRLTSTFSREAGSGYLKKIWTAATITPALGKITINNPNKGMAYGAAYWQYFEDINKVSRQSTNVAIEKTLFREVITPKGNEWVSISADNPLKIGDRIMVRLLIRANRSVDFVHIQDMRASAFEPETLLSSYRREGGLAFYEEIKDATTNFFIRHLPRGTFVLEYPLLVTQQGVFTNGIARVQSLYLPSFAAHSSGSKIKVR